MFDPDKAIAEAVIREEIEVPPYPSVAMRLNRLINSDNYDVAKLTEVVSTDAAVSARVVGIANSAAYRRSGGDATTVEQAVSRLGAAEVAQIAMASGLGDVATSEGPLAELKYLVWRRTLYTAFVCKELAAGRKLDAAEALLCGLLAGLGKAVTLSCAEDLVQKERHAGALSIEEWLRIVDHHQGHIGLFIARKWEVPSFLLQVLDQLSRGAAPGRESLPLTLLVQGADLVVRCLEEGPVPDQGRLALLLKGPQELQKILSLAPELPKLVDSLASDRPKRPPRGKKPRPREPVLIEATPLDVSDLVPLGVDARIPLKSAEIKVSVASIGHRRAILKSPEPMRPNWVSRLVIWGEPAFLDLWVNVKGCEPLDGSYLVEVQPFALSGKPAQHWAKMVADAAAKHEKAGSLPPMPTRLGPPPRTKTG